MTNISRSARGEMVDFDLLKIKQQMVNTPKPIVVEARENFIDNKFKRQLKRQTSEAVSMVSPTELPESTEKHSVDVVEVVETKSKDNKAK